MKRYSQAQAESMNDMKFAFVQESFVYDYLRPRRNLLASCAGICRKGITCWQKERLPYFI